MQEPSEDGRAEARGEVGVGGFDEGLEETWGGLVEVWWELGEGGGEPF